MGKSALKIAKEAGAEVKIVPTPVITNNEVRKVFGGSIGDMDLKITIRVDNKEDMERMLKLLDSTREDIQRELDKFNNSKTSL